MNNCSVAPSIITGGSERPINAEVLKIELCGLVFHHRTVDLLSETYPERRLAQPARQRIPCADKNLYAQPMALGVQLGC